VVLNESTYKERISSLLKSKDPTSQIERKTRQLLTKYKTVLPVALKRQLTPYHSKPSRFYGLPKIHTPDIPLRPIVSSIDSPCYALPEFLHKILSPLAGNTSSFTKNSEHSIKSIKDITLQKEDCLVSFDVVSLFTNVPVGEVLQVVRDRLSTDPSFLERAPLQVEDVMELLDICLKTMYFQFEDTFDQQKEGMAVGNSLSPVVSNIFMEHSEEIALDTANYKPAKLLRYVDDTFVVWPHGPATLNFLTI
jgi:hypothetical protein